MPVCTSTPCFRNAEQNSSYSATACSGRAAAIKLGRRCPRASPYKVNCDTTSAAPFTSSSDLFIFPCSSSKMRKFAHFSAIEPATAAVSASPTPSRIISPDALDPVTRDSTVTCARLTRCSTALIESSTCAMASSTEKSFRQSFSPSLSPSFSQSFRLSRRRLHRLARQQIRKLRHVVRKHREHLRAFGQIVPTHAIERVGLRVMRLVVIDVVLHTIKSRHARFVERNVIRSAFRSQTRLRQSHTRRGRERIQNVVHRFARRVISHHANCQNFSGPGIV